MMANGGGTMTLGDSSISPEHWCDVQCSGHHTTMVNIHGHHPAPARPTEMDVLGNNIMISSGMCSICSATGSHASLQQLFSNYSLKINLSPQMVGMCHSLNSQAANPGHQGVTGMLNIENRPTIILTNQPNIFCHDTGPIIVTASISTCIFPPSTPDQ